MRDATDAYDKITQLNCGVLEQKLELDAARITRLRKIEPFDIEADRVSQLLGAASLLLEEAARHCLNSREVRYG